MHFDLAAIPANEAYKLLVSTVVPRPIALATTVDANGRVNAAPFSFFNAVSSVPPVVVLGISPGDPDAPPSDGYKDTERNIRDTGEFVVNLVDEAIAERMNVCAVDFPNTVGELEHADLHPIPSVGVRPPRIAESPVSFECKRITGLSLGPRSTLEVGRVIHIHIRDDLVDPAALLRRDREDAPDRPHAWPRLVCPHQRPVPDGPHQLRRLERRQAMRRRRGVGRVIGRGVRGLALAGLLTSAARWPGRRPGASNRRRAARTSPRPARCRTISATRPRRSVGGRRPRQPGADRFNTAPSAAELRPCGCFDVAADVQHRGERRARDIPDQADARQRRSFRFAAARSGRAHAGNTHGRTAIALLGDAGFPQIRRAKELPQAAPRHAAQRHADTPIGASPLAQAALLDRAAPPAI